MINWRCFKPSWMKGSCAKEIAFLEEGWRRSKEKREVDSFLLSDAARRYESLTEKLNEQEQVITSLSGELTEERAKYDYQVWKLEERIKELEGEVMEQKEELGYLQENRRFGVGAIGGITIEDDPSVAEETLAEGIEIPEPEDISNRIRKRKKKKKGH